MTILRKTLAVALLAGFTSTSVDAQTLFTYGNYSVSKDEFLKAFNKNNAGLAGTPEAYKDYLELYTKFKLKVRAAKDLRLDTLASQQAELVQFRDQVAENFINDDKIINSLVQEAFERSKKEIHLAHIYIAIPEPGNPASEKDAEVKIQSAYTQLDKGTPFETVALANSTDPSVKLNNGDIGFITAFTLGYELENLAYTTPVNKYSKPFRTKGGFHIFKNLGERKSLGKLRVAQVLIAVRDEFSAGQKQDAQKLADSVYKAAKAGADFKLLAAKYSSDNLSYQTGGELMEFGVGRYAPAFENAAYGLQKDGDISIPVLTEFGYHIIKRLAATPVPETLAEGRERDAMKQLVYQSDRMAFARKKQVASIKDRLGFKTGVYSNTAFLRATDSILKNAPLPQNPSMTPKTILFSIGTEKITLKDWQDHLLAVRNTSTHLGKEQIYSDFQDARTLSYYKKNLEKFNPDFAFQVDEFRDGNLLFEIMQRKIWDKAAADSAGLKKYYDQHKTKYKWEPSADAVIFTFADQELADQTRSKIESNWKDWNKIAEASEGRLQGDSARFELSQIPVPDRTNFQPGLLTANAKNDNDNSVSYAYIIKMYPGSEQRDFNAARGFVINDYQQQLEEEWIKELKKKYPVKVNMAVLK